MHPGESNKIIDYIFLKKVTHYRIFIIFTKSYIEFEYIIKKIVLNLTIVTK